jgi:hypothetical protein
MDQGRLLERVQISGPARLLSVNEAQVSGTLVLDEATVAIL